MSASEDNNKAFTDRQRETYDALPATTSEIATALGIQQSAVRDHISSLRNECGVPLSRDEHGIYYDRSKSGESMNATAPADEPVVDESSLAQHTIKKKEVLLEMKRTLARSNTDRPVVADGGITTEPGNEDVVIHRSDDHLGAEYEDEFDNPVFNPEIAKRRVQNITDKVMELVERQQKAGVEYDNAHLLLGGDTVHGEGIHKDQPWESALTLIEQIDMAEDLYTDQIERLRDKFDTVQVVCQNGNHGELRGDGMSEDANADDIVYLMLEKAADNRDWDDVTILRSSGSNFTNFTMRGHRGHLRHGQKSLFHIGTSSGENRWRGWQGMHDFDIAYRGHFHEFRLENIDSDPVLMSGSVCPPSDFEEGLATWSEPAATVHGVSDSRPMTWLYPIDFNDARVEVSDEDSAEDSVMSA